MTLLVARVSAAPKETVLHSFNGAGGFAPTASLISDAAGNLYGTTFLGGGTCAGYCGMVFQLTPQAGGGWKETVLHTFGKGKDGVQPFGGLILDTAGNLYGTTLDGGSKASCDRGCGTVFELSPNAGGGWTEKILHNFNGNGRDGTNPAAGLIFDKSGNLYGTTSYGGVRNHGTVFELSPKTGGGWSERVLYSFTHGNKQDGRLPYAGLVVDAAGNLYGTTFEAGGCPRAGGCGTVFKLMPQAGGGWTEKVLHSFKVIDRYPDYPTGSLIVDASGNLYGATSRTVFELTPQAGGTWTETVLHTFVSTGDGGGPQGPLIFDAAGNLFSTTAGGGANQQGTVFELTPQTGGGWTETILHSFLKNGKDASGPQAGLIFDASGNLFGTTAYGGTSTCPPYGYGCGTVFEVTP